MDLSTCSNPETWVEDPGGSFAGCIEPDPGRYVMYVNAACAFSGRSWFLIKFYGMEAVFQIVKTWPANSPDSWFFKPVSEWEKNAVESHPGVCVRAYSAMPGPEVLCGAVRGMCRSGPSA